MPGRVFEIPAELGIPGHQLIIGRAAPFGEFPIFNLLIATEVNWRKAGPFQARLCVSFYSLFRIAGDFNRAVHQPHLFGGEPEFLFQHSDNHFFGWSMRWAKWEACCPSRVFGNWTYDENPWHCRKSALWRLGVVTLPSEAMVSVSHPRNTKRPEGAGH